VELGAGPLDEHGRRRLSKREILSALRHTLTDRAEDGSNMAVTKPLVLAAFERKTNPGDSQAVISRLNAAGNAAAVTLETSEEVAALVRELLDTPLPSGQLDPHAAGPSEVCMRTRIRSQLGHVSGSFRPSAEVLAGRARQMRGAPTASEGLLWGALRGSQPGHS
jgi:hypothetical protein